MFLIKQTINAKIVYHLLPHRLHFQVLPASLIAPITPNAAVLATLVPVDILLASTEPQLGQLGIQICHIKGSTNNNTGYFDGIITCDKYYKFRNEV